MKALKAFKNLIGYNEVNKLNWKQSVIRFFFVVAASFLCDGLKGLSISSHSFVE
jgi:hypothetical protein